MTDTTKPNGDRDRPSDREAAKNPCGPAMGPPKGTASSGSTPTGGGWHWAWQRCGRYEYRKVLMHSTNPDHLVPSAARGSGGFLRVAARYAAGMKRCSTTS